MVRVDIWTYEVTFQSEISPEDEAILGKVGFAGCGYVIDGKYYIVATNKTLEEMRQKFPSATIRQQPDGPISLPFDEKEIPE